MNRTLLLLPIAAFVLWLGNGTRQISQAQVTVQLPTFHVTGVSTTVVVPDRGGVYLGGVTNSSVGTSSFGSPFGGHLPGLQRNLGNRSFRQSTTSDFWVGASIIDHSEIDRALLAEANQRRNLRLPRARQELVQVPPEREPDDARPIFDSQPGLAGESQRAAVYLARAERAESSGQPQVAKIFYQRIAKHGNATQKEKAKQRLASIDAVGKR